MPAEDDAKLNSGLLEILRKKFPNASPGALERLKTETESNPLAAAVIPADWTELAIDKSSTKEYTPMPNYDALWQQANMGNIGSSANQAIGGSLYNNALGGLTNSLGVSAGQAQTLGEIFDLQNAYNRYPTGLATTRWYQDGWIMPTVTGPGYGEATPLPVQSKPAAAPKPKKLETVERGQRSILLDGDF